jgi:WG containing repeat
MKRIHVAYVLGVLMPTILHLSHQQPSKAQSFEELCACIAKFEKIRVEAEKVKPDGLIPFLHGYQQLGYRDKKGRVVVPPRFTEARRFSNGRAVVADRNWYQGFINSRGELVIPHKFFWVSDFAKGIAVFSGTKEDRELNGIIDVNGNVLLTFRGAIPEAEFNGFDQNGRVSVFVHDLSREYGNPVPKIWGYVDCTGKVTLEKKQ